METGKTQHDEQVIEENKAYILGLYDLYQNDRDIEAMLAQKGLTYYQILLVLESTNRARLQKRVRQAKRLLISGTSITAGLWAIYFIFKHIPGADTLLSGKDAGDGMLRGTFYVYREFFYFVVFGFSCQAILGAILLVERRRQWKDFQKKEEDHTASSIS